MNKSLADAIRIFLPKFGLKDQDIIFSTFPKSGTTWFRFIIANIVCIEEFGGKIVDYNVLNNELNSAYNQNWRSKLKYNVIPEFRSTHREYSEKLFSENKSVYLYRNPKDTLVSYYNYRCSFRKKPYLGTFKEFIRSEWGITAWSRHLDSWVHKADVSISYEDLKLDTINAIKKILTRVDILNIPEVAIKEAVKRSDFKMIKEMERDKGRDKRSIRKHKLNFVFARRGKMNDNDSYYEKDDIEYMNNVMFNYKVDKYYTL